MNEAEKQNQLIKELWELLHKIKEAGMIIGLKNGIAKPYEMKIKFR